MIKGWGALFCFSAGTLLFQCWHSGTLLFSIECFSAGTQALWGFQLSVSVLALWHCTYFGFGGLSVAVLALWHAAVDMAMFLLLMVSDWC